MLSLTRKRRQGVKITLPDGQIILIVIREFGRGQVRIGVEAPKECPIDRVDQVYRCDIIKNYSESAAETDSFSRASIPASEAR